MSVKKLKEKDNKIPVETELKPVRIEPKPVGTGKGTTIRCFEDLVEKNKGN